MVNAWNLFVGRCFILLLLATSGGTEAPPTSWSKNQEILSLIINETFSSNNFTTSHSSCPDKNSRNVSAFWKNQCSVNNGMVGRHSTEKDSRIGCCQPNYVTYLYDVKIEGGKFLLYHSNSPAEPSKLRVSKHKLPPMTSMMMQIRHEFNMDVEERYSSDGRPTHCSSIFPGTLHVVGRSTVNNVYHATVDNVMAVVSLILTDKEVDSEFLHSPRMMFDGFWPGPNSDAVSHLEMMDRLMSAGYSSLAQAEGKCFRRVVWGGGPSIFYSDTRVVLRRLCSDFGRIMMRRCYDMKMPSAFKSSVGDLEVIQSHLESVSPVPPLPLKSTVPIPGTVLTTSSAISTNESESGHHLANGPDTGLTMMKSTDLMGSLHLGKLQVNGRPLRVVLYTRGNSGTKRTIQGESTIIDALNSLGAQAVICDYHDSSVWEQIAFAYHADVILGLHGAALVHTIFAPKGVITIELKTLYGYTSMTFALTTDSRQGLHGQLDVREYWKPGGHKPVDQPLVDRILSAVRIALVMNTSTESPISQVKMLDRKGDFLSGPSEVTVEMNDFFGPRITAQSRECSRMIFKVVRDLIGSTDNDHCDE